MKTTKKLLASAVAASALSVAMVPAANAEVAASVGIASTYLWRGADLGSGTPQISGDLSYSNSGAYGGVWVASGDTAAGTEYDLYIGYGTELGPVSVDVSLWSYNYPTGAGYTADAETDLTDFTDLVLSLGAGPVALTIYEPVGDDNSPGDYRYVTLGGSFGDFSATVGIHMDNAGAVPCPADETDPTCDPIHVDFSYAYNDNLSFTLSQFIADETSDDDLKVVVSYSIPIE
ncbi:MAG: TorF family putative porin [Agarilytica sp.]